MIITPCPPFRTSLGALMQAPSSGTVSLIQIPRHPLQKCICLNSAFTLAEDLGTARQQLSPQFFCYQEQRRFLD